MKSSTKACVVHRSLGFLLVWPFFHYYFVMLLDANPWKLVGFSMYCTPHTVDIQVFDRSPGRALAITSNLAEESRTEFRRLQERRQTVGALASPDALARAIFRERPRTDRLSVSVGVSQLERFGRRKQTSTREYTYVRDMAR